MIQLSAKGIGMAILREEEVIVHVHYVLLAAT